MIRTTPRFVRCRACGGFRTAERAMLQPPLDLCANCAQRIERTARLPVGLDHPLPFPVPAIALAIRIAVIGILNCTGVLK